MTILYHGLINWLVTIIMTESRLFEDYRTTVQRYAQKIAPKHPNLAGKLNYVVTCPLCTGVWVGLVQALCFDGPLHFWVLGWIANGLLYKAVGHLILEIAAIGKNTNTVLVRKNPVRW